MAGKKIDKKIKIALAVIVFLLISIIGYLVYNELKTGTTPGTTPGNTPGNTPPPPTPPPPTPPTPTPPTPTPDVVTRTCTADPANGAAPCQGNTNCMFVRDGYTNPLTRVTQKGNICTNRLYYTNRMARDTKGESVPCSHFDTKSRRNICEYNAGNCSWNGTTCVDRED